jgi:hypothetical protein
MQYMKIGTNNSVHFLNYKRRKLLQRSAPVVSALLCMCLPCFATQISPDANLTKKKEGDRLPGTLFTYKYLIT